MIFNATGIILLLLKQANKWKLHSKSIFSQNFDWNVQQTHDFLPFPENSDSQNFNLGPCCLPSKLLFFSFLFSYKNKANASKNKILF